MPQMMCSFLLFALVTVSIATPVSAESATFCDDNLGRATASIRASRLRLMQVEGASNAEVCAALRDYVGVVKAARVVFDRCLTGRLRKDLLADPEGSFAHLEMTVPALCPE